ncbi:ARM repeat-containing protein [Trichoderma longibrachiatum ATCC 18648]|uniref:Translation initiation factor eIF2B subunit epsilon n=1 Tax=Trichoderma longibrachiatum ATCC 18648 TaxID=983965 RepID=A0A2T4C6N0_TRILO|nr:ARM repeat-containing protein [Trichoderma longibrachiatum ATCC 18648]
MSHKGKNSASSAKGKKPSKAGAESKGEDVLQAVCLLPLANTPLIEYTLEFLAMNGVQEVYIYCGAHTDQVEDYIGRSRWAPSSKSCPFSVLQFVRVADARSIGDVLRDMDKRSLVDGDFLLVHGDMVSNLILDSALAAHRKRREMSAANIMTMILHSGGTEEHRTKTKGITPVFVVDTKTQRCLHYDEMNPLQSDHYLAVSQSILAGNVVVGKGCTIPAGSLISYGVRISDGIAFSTAAVLSTVTSTGKPVTADASLVGPDGNAAPFYDPEDDELDDEDPSRLQKSLIYSLANYNLSSSSISTLASDADSDSDDDMDGNNLLSADAANSSRSRLSSFASDDSAGKMSFHADAVHGLLDALRADSGDFDSAKLEFMGLRLANNASDAMMRKAVATAFVRRAVELVSPEQHRGGLDPSKAAERAFTACRGAPKFVNEVGVGLGGGEAAQVEFVLALQRALSHYYAKGQEQKTATLLPAMLQQLYALDILEEEGILGWWADPRAVDGEAMAALKEKCRVLVEWLENAEEEDEDDDDDDDDSD